MAEKVTIRERQEKREHDILSKHATFADMSKGREIREPDCDIRTVFQRDRDRIIHSKSFRRLKQKTQVFLEPVGDHYRTRLTHTLEVAQNARTIARALKLNEDLTEAIALGHDLGHTPFGHAGERALSKIMVSLGEKPFRHNEQSVRVVERLEKDGKGLNLTYEVKDGILNHEIDLTPATPEGRIVRLSDKIAYTNSDIDDAIRAGILTEEDLPEDSVKVLGNSMRERLNTLVHDMITNAENNDYEIGLSKEIHEAFFKLREYMFKNVYSNPLAKSEEKKVDIIIDHIFNYYAEKPNEMPDEFHEIMESEGKNRAVCDFIACMSDTYLVNIYKDLMIPKAWGLAGNEHR
ncbi:MAG: deoxyguanosinetriphosphate triphosphohydrolase [Lachnospiraceae bacterium]|nr:deoxyguanosinetriphosphate triphosphohydrolase [Lachnospiraceae bacterium]